MPAGFDVSELVGLARGFTWLDWTVLAVIALSAVRGTRRGLLVGVLDLLSVVVAYGVAVVGYQPAADLLVQRGGVPGPLASIAAFLGLLVLGQMAYGLLVNTLLLLARPLLRGVRPLWEVDRLLGVLPGALKGLITVSVLLLPFTLLPLLPDLSAAIERSTVASRLVGLAANEAPQLWARLPFARDVALPGPDLLTPLRDPAGSPLPGGPLPGAGTGTILSQDATVPIPAAPEESLEADAEAETGMLALMNDERAKVGLQPLVMDEALRQVARAHSREMFVQGYFSHNSPTTGSPFDRMRVAGIRFLVAGENLAYAPSLPVAHQGLMTSPGHRANILRAEFGRVGIGAIRTRVPLRGMLFAQEFTNR